MAFSFGSFRLEPDEARLTRDDQRVSVTPKAFEVLCLLVERAGSLVTKRELFDRVWADVFVGDAVLKVCVRELRKALRDNARDPSYIETVHRRGYRFVARVETEATARRDSRQEPRTILATPARGVPSSERSTPGHPVSSRLVGRERERRELDRKLDLASAGQPRIVFLTGEPGLGKSALLEDFVATVRGQGVRVLRGRCIELHGPSEPYLPLIESLETLARQENLGEAAARGELARHAPTWLAQIPWLLDQEARDRLEHDLLGVTRERMMREFAEIVESLAHDAPLVLAIEDLHWSDFATADALAYLASRSPRSRWLVVGTRRPHADLESSRSPSLALDELQLAGLADEIRVSRLDEAAVLEYLSERDPTLADRRAVAQVVHARTGGNALFLRSLVDELLARGGVRSLAAWSAVPDSTRRWIQRQMARLAAPEVRLVEAACVVGDFFSSHDVAAALERPLAEIDHALAALARRGWPVLAAGDEERPEGRLGGRFEFVHALYREVLYEGLAIAERALFHQRVAEAKERAFEGRLESVAAELAGHFDRAGALESARRYYALAAGSSARVCAHAESLALLSRAEAVVSRMRPGERATLARFEIFEARGHVKLSLGDLRAAAREFASWRELASGTGDRDAELRALLAMASASSWFDREACLGSIDEARRLGQTVEDPRVRAQTAFWSSYWHLLWSGWSLEGATAARDAMQVLAATESVVALGPLRARYAFFLALGGCHAESVSATREARDAALRAGDGFEYLLAAFFEAWSLLESASWVDVARVLEDANRIAARNGHAQWQVLFQLLDAALLVELDLLDLAAESITRSLVEARALENRFSIALALVLRATVAVRSCDSRLAKRLLAEVDTLLEGGVLMGGLCHAIAGRLRVELAVLLDPCEPATLGLEGLLAETGRRGDQNERAVLESLGAWKLARAGQRSDAARLVSAARRAMTRGQGRRGEPFVERAEALLGAGPVTSRGARLGSGGRRAGARPEELVRERWRDALVASGWIAGGTRLRESPGSSG